MNQEDINGLIIELAAETKKLSIKINFSELEENGVLIKAGAWYRVSDLQKLPEHVQLNIKALAQDSKGIKVKFYKENKFDLLADRFSEMAKKLSPHKGIER